MAWIMIVGDDKKKGEKGRDNKRETPPFVVPTKLVDIQTKALWMSTPHVCKRTRQLSGVGGKGEKWGRRRDEVSVESRCKGCRVGRVRLTRWCALTGKSYDTAKYGTEAGTRVNGLTDAWREKEEHYTRRLESLGEAG